jgi:hypothetical protein
MALTRITSNVIKDATITEGKFDKPYLDATNSDTATQSITFQSDVTIKVGSAGNPYFTASANQVTITAPTNSDVALGIQRGNITVGDGDITIAGTRKLEAPYVNVGSGTSSIPSIYFGPSSTSGFYYSDSPQGLGFTVNGVVQLELVPTDGIKFGNRTLKILGDGQNYADIVTYNTQTSSIEFGNNTNIVQVKTGGDNVISVRSVNGSGAAYTGNENRVGINNNNPQAALDVTGTIRASAYANISDSDLPVIPINKGGTGLTQAGFPEQLLRVNSSGTGFEYFTLNTGDVNNLASFNVSGDGTLYDVTNRGTSSGRLTVTVNDASTFFNGQDIKLFGINTTDIVQYDANTVGTTIYSTWKNSIDQSTSFTTAQGGVGGAVRYTYYAALINFNTGVISSLKTLKHSSTGTQIYVENYELDTFNDQRYNSVSLLRPNASHGILLYRYKSTTAVVKDRDGNGLPGHDSNANLIAIIGQRDIGSSTTTLFTYNDYGPYNRTTWGDFNTDGSYNQNYLKIKNIPCSVSKTDIPNFGPYPGWSERNVFDVNQSTNTITVSNADAGDLYDATDLSSAFIDDIQVCHDDTAALTAAIQSVIDKKQFSLFLTGGTYLVKNLKIPSNFSLSGSGKATILKKQYFDTSYNTTPSPEYSRLYSAIWLRNPVTSLGAPSINVSQPVENITLRSFAIDGNYNNNIRLGDSTRPDANALVYLADSENCSLSDLDIKNSIGDGIYAESAKRLSLQNISVYDNSITYLTFDNPLQATDAEVLKVSDCAFLSNPGPADVTTSQVVAFNSCIIRNSGTGLRIYGARSVNVENNLILGPDDEWIPSSDIYDSDFNSVNLRVYKSTGAGTQGPVKFTYVENNIAKDLTNTTVTPYVYSVLVDQNGNETLSANPIEYIPTGSSSSISVLQSNIYDIANGGVQVEIPSGSGSGTALNAIPYRSIVGIQGTNYNYLVYYVVGNENIAVGDPDNYIIDGVIDYDPVNLIYTVRIADEYISEFIVEDRVQLLEHNPTNGYSLPSELIVSAIRFEQQSFVLDLFNADFATFNATYNSANIDAGGDLTIDQNARGYIKKKRSFTIAKGIIGVV